MKRFRFRLARVERVRVVEERAARARLAEAQARASAAEQSADELRASLMDARAEAAACGAGPATRLLWDRALDAGLRSALAARERAHTAHSQAEALRPAWADKRSAAEGLARLRERRADEHAIEERREEARETDEVANRRFAEKQRPPETGANG